MAVYYTTNNEAENFPSFLPLVSRMWPLSLDHRPCLSPSSLCLTRPRKNLFLNAQRIPAGASPALLHKKSGEFRRRLSPWNSVACSTSGYLPDSGRGSAAVQRTHGRCKLPPIGHDAIQKRSLGNGFETKQQKNNQIDSFYEVAMTNACPIRKPFFTATNPLHTSYWRTCDG